MGRATVSAALGLAGLLVLSPPAAVRAQSERPEAEGVKRGAEQGEQEEAAARAARAEARAQQAWAEGKREVAGAEWRRVVAYREAHLKGVRELYARGRVCTDEPLRAAEGRAAIARARLAEAEARPKALLVELPKVVAYYEWRIATVESLLRHAAIAEGEARAELKRLGAELNQARVRLAILGGGLPRPRPAGTGREP